MADAGRRAGEDDVARVQRKDRRQPLDEGGDGEDEVAGAGVLDDLAVYAAADFEVVAIGQLIGRNDFGPDGRETRERLTDAELRRGADQLTGPLGQVLPGSDARDVIPCPCRVNADGTPADDDDQFRFPVHGRRRQLHHVVGAGYRGLELGEHRRFGRQLHLALASVVGVIQPDREHLRRARGGRLEAAMVEGPGKRRPEAAGPGDELVPAGEHGLRVCGEPPVAGFLHVGGAVRVLEHEPAVKIGDTHAAHFPFCSII